MALSQRVINELYKELAKLQALQDSAGAKIQALEAVLAEHTAGSSTRLQRALSAGRAGRVPGLSLRANVLKTLQTQGSSAAADVYRHLENQGVRVGGTTTLRERVAHELSRLRRQGVVRRGRDGKYELPTPAGVNEVRSSGASAAQELLA